MLDHSHKAMTQHMELFSQCLNKSKNSGEFHDSWTAYGTQNNWLREPLLSARWAFTSAHKYMCTHRSKLAYTLTHTELRLQTQTHSIHSKTQRASTLTAHKCSWMHTVEAKQAQNMQGPIWWAAFGGNSLNSFHHGVKTLSAHNVLVCNFSLFSSTTEKHLVLLMGCFSFNFCGYTDK